MTSSQPVQTPNALVFTPDNLHCYAYNRVAVSTTAVNQLDFKTNSEYIVGIINCNGAVDMGNVDRGQITAFQIQFNGVPILQLKTDTETEDIPGTVSNNIIIPPFTHVVITADSDAANFGFTSVAFTGKAYGMTATGYQ